MVEIVNKVQAISLNYGTITRDSPIRLECVPLDYHMFSTEAQSGCRKTHLKR